MTTTTTTTTPDATVRILGRYMRNLHHCLLDSKSVAQRLVLQVHQAASVDQKWIPAVEDPLLFQLYQPKQSSYWHYKKYTYIKKAQVLCRPWCHRVVLNSTSTAISTLLADMWWAQLMAFVTTNSLQFHDTYLFLLQWHTVRKHNINYCNAVCQFRLAYCNDLMLW